jgi:taurine dioxygenase
MWASTSALYAKLSPSFRAYLDGLTALHDSLQAGHGRHKATETLSSTQQKYPKQIHPVVRTHPLTGARCLYVNSGFTTKLIGLGDRESKGILNMLFEHIAMSPECHVRFKWSPHSIAIWDNRITQHMALWWVPTSNSVFCQICSLAHHLSRTRDYYPFSRNGYRVTTKGEKPFFDKSKGVIGDMDEEGLLEELARIQDAKTRAKI